MRLLFRLRSLARNLLRREQVEQELSEEISAQLELLTVANLEEGLVEKEARRAAALEIGGVEQLKEQVREVRMGHRLEALFDDLRQALRFLAKNPAFTGAVVGTLALGLGASTAGFCLVKGTLRSSLGQVGLAQLLRISVASPMHGEHEADLSIPRLNLIRAHQKVFIDVIALVGERWTLSRMGGAEQVSVARVSEGFFELLATQPLSGRLFTIEENRATARPVALLDYRSWQTRFHGDPAIVGQRLTLHGRPTTIVGILPPDFESPFGEFDLFVPRVFDVGFLAKDQIRRGAGFVKVIARLKPNVSLEDARRELAAIDDQYRSAAHDNMDANAAAILLPLHESVVRGTRPLLYAIASAVLCIMALASLNVLNLLLAQLARRRRELAVRHALGATRWRVAQQLFCEVFWLITLAGICAIFLAHFGLTMINLLGRDLLAPGPVRLDATALLFALLLVCLIGIIVCLASAAHVRHSHGRETLRASSGTSVRRSSLTGIRALLVIAQLALSLLLLAAGGLLLESFHRLRQVNPGINSEGVFIADISPESGRDADETGATFQPLIRKLEATSGIAAAAAVYGLPLTGNDTFISYAVADRPVPPAGNRAVTWYRSVSPDYFRTMQIPLRAGRAFRESDRPGQPNVVILSETTARLLFGDRNPIGQRIVCGGTMPTANEIVGVVGDVRSHDLASTVREEMYFSMYQTAEPSMQLVVRAESAYASAQTVERTISAALAQLAPGRSVTALQAMDEIIARSVARRRFLAILVGLCACLALSVATVGTYSVTDRAVSERIREIGIRLALGARPGDIFWLMIISGMRPVAAGIMIGTIFIFVSGRTLSGLLFGISATDPGILAGAMFLLSAVALAANYLPARRAMRVAPRIALSCE